MQRHLFITDPIENLNQELDTSLKLAKNLYSRGHLVAFATQNSISLCNNGPFVASQKVDSWPISTLSQPHIFTATPLRDFDAIHFRTDPPTNENYWVSTWILSQVPATTLIFNKPTALRDLNEKLLILNYPEDSAPALLSSNPAQIKKFIESQCYRYAIAKPLTLFGGKGVVALDFRTKKGLSEAIKSVTTNGTELRLFQPFNESIFSGEVRAFAVGGKCISWCLKLPQPGSFLANTGAGATIENYQPTASLNQRLDRIAEDLMKKGVYYIGFDIIGDLVSEINITSPRLLTTKPEEMEAFLRLTESVEDLVTKNNRSKNHQKT